MPSRQLIYLTVFGTAMRPLAEACVQSLRVAGRFEGDVWVFCDGPPVAGGAEHRPVAARTDWQEICAARIDLGLTLPFARYDAIAYVDADCLSTAPVAPLFDGMDVFRAMRDVTVLGTSRGANAGLTDAERKRAQCPAACAGVFAGGAKVLEAALSAWRSAYQATPPDYFRDQHALNALIYRGVIPARLYPWTVVAPVSREADAGRRAPLLHFWGEWKGWMLPAWQSWRRRQRRGTSAGSDAEAPRFSALGVRRGVARRLGP